MKLRSTRYVWHTDLEVAVRNSWSRKYEEASRFERSSMREDAIRLYRSCTSEVTRATLDFAIAALLLEETPCEF